MVEYARARSADESGRPARGPSLMRFRWPLLLGLAALAVHPFDASIVAALNPDPPDPLDGVGLWMDAWSTRLLLLALFAALFVSYLVGRFRGWRVPATAVIAGWLASEVVVGTLKRGVGRPRPLHPAAMADLIRPLYDRPDTKSFPSGHAATAIGCAVVVAVWVRHPAARVLILAFGGLVGLSRCYVGAHYFSDVLAGAAIGWFCMIVAWRVVQLERDRLAAVTAPRRLAVLTAAAGLIVAGWLLKSPAVMTDWANAMPASGFSTAPTTARILLEPGVGFGLEISAVPDLRPWCYAAAGWLAVLALVLGLVWRRRGLVATAALVAFAGMSFTVAVSGSALQGPLVARPGADEGDRRPLAFDFQSHIGDPTDGSMSLEAGLERFRRLGFRLVVPTWHNASARGFWRPEGVEAAWEPIDLWGMEWSSGSHLETPLHILVLGSSPISPELVRETDYRRMVAAARAAGHLVVVAHYWRGDRGRLPGLAELREAGVHGFEVVGRSQEFRDEPLDRQRELKEFVREHGLLALGNGDFHGKRSANYQWNVDDFAGRPDGAALISRLRSVGGSRPRVITLERERPPAAFRGWLAPWHTCAQYLRGMGLAGRAVWLTWIFAIGAVWLRFARRTPAQ